VLDLSEKVCVVHNRERGERVVPVAVIRRQIRDLKASLLKISKEGFAFTYLLESRAAVDAVKIRHVRRSARIGA
jgi:predicted kinase